MFKNYIKITLRNIKRQKIYSTINIAGLAIGLCISMVIAFYVRDDLTFDRFHDHAESIYRTMITRDVEGEGARVSAITSGPLLPAAKNELPEVLGATRVTSFGEQLIARRGTGTTENEETNQVSAMSLVTDPGFFDVFSFKILKGDVSALATPNGILLTPETARALFGEDDPMGQPLQIRPVKDAYVAGIVESPPSNSHIQFDIIFPLRVEMNPQYYDSWKNQAISGYIRIHEDADWKSVEEKIIKIARENGFTEIFTPILQPLLDIHMHSTGYFYDSRNYGKTDTSVVYALSAIGAMILLIAAINFINLSSARAAKRAREVGMRKVIGSSRFQLVTQFLGESILITFTAMVIAIFLLELTLPSLEGFLGKNLEISIFSNPMLFLILSGFAIVIGVLSGIYPALILSAFRPIRVLRGEFQSGRAGILIRRILVVFQFAITISLIIGVFTVFVQIKYIQTMDLGYNREQVMAVSNFLRNRDDSLKDRLKKIPGVLSLGKTNTLPGSFGTTEAFPEGKNREKKFMFKNFVIDEGFFDTLEISIALGRNFSREFATDAQDAVIINEAAVRFSEWENPIGKRLYMAEPDGTMVPKRVVGVVKDFHYAKARDVIDPMLFLFNPQQCPMLLVRLGPGRITQTKNSIESMYKELVPNRDFSYLFLDDLFNEQFTTDREFASNLGFFSGVAIFIACLGLLGLVSFAVDQRGKEIAIRKVLGSGEGRIITLLASDFLKWVVLANIIAWPLGYFSMDKWLSEFVYKAPFSIFPYILSGAGAALIAFLTISVQSFKAAQKNPADILRKEM